MVTFQDALDAVEALPLRQQEDLLHLLRSRHIEIVRESLSENIKEGREEYRRGEVRRGTADDLMRDLSE